MSAVSGGDPNVDHTARRLIVELQALVERLQRQLEHVDARVREDTKIVRHTLTLIGDEIFQDQRRRKEQREIDAKLRAEEQKRDTAARIARQKELDHVLFVMRALLIAIVSLLLLASALWIGARFL